MMRRFNEAVRGKDDKAHPLLSSIPAQDRARLVDHDERPGEGTGPDLLRMIEV